MYQNVSESLRDKWLAQRLNPSTVKSKEFSIALVIPHETMAVHMAKANIAA